MMKILYEIKIAMPFQTLVPDGTQPRIEQTIKGKSQTSTFYVRKSSQFK